MTYEVSYKRTPSGEFEIKTIPSGKMLYTEIPLYYFDVSDELFMRLFRYIKQQKLSMLLPVEAEIYPGIMRFHVKSSETSLPLPEISAVKVCERSAGLVAALGIRGAYSPAVFMESKQRLTEWLAKHPAYEADGEAYMTYWNSPMVPFFLRHSEVHIPVKRKTAAETTTTPLTQEEKSIIADKGTEPPFSGRYHDFFQPGIYVCRQCGAPLYRSDDKFSTNCGWPGFDDALPGAIITTGDTDGIRTEISCASCNGHLGHLFTGETLTPKNIRYCTNSLALKFVPGNSGKIGRAIFAGGCFWGVEYFMKNALGVIAVTSGYIGGSSQYPAYNQVCRGNTGYAEAVEIIYDKNKTDFTALAKLFFEIHDPTQTDRQGTDIGNQYRSVIFYLNDEQQETAAKLIGILKEKGFNIATTLQPAGRFWPAEEYHQNYYTRKNAVPYCHAYTKRF